MEEQDAYINTQSVKKRIQETTKVWLLCIKWKDATTSWEPLVSLKESNPVDFVEYAMSS